MIYCSVRHIISSKYFGYQKIHLFTITPQKNAQLILMRLTVKMLTRRIRVGNRTLEINIRNGSDSNGSTIINRYGKLRK